MATAHETTTFTTLEGTPGEMLKRLKNVQAERVLVVAIHHADDARARLWTQTLANVAPFIDSALARQSEQIVKAVVDAVLPRHPPTPTMLKEASMLARSRMAVLDSGDWLTAAQIATVAGLSPTNPSTQPNKWKREGRIFAIHHNGTDYFPRYGLDPEVRWRPRKALKSVLEVFGEDKDGWGLAYWFLSANSFLGGRRPQDVLRVEPQLAVAAAKDEVEGVTHG